MNRPNTQDYSHDAHNTKRCSTSCPYSTTIRLVMELTGSIIVSRGLILLVLYRNCDVVPPTASTTLRRAEHHGQMSEMETSDEAEEKKDDSSVSEAVNARSSLVSESISSDAVSESAK